MIEEADTTTTSRILMSGGRLYIQVAQQGQGTSTSSGIMYLTGYNNTTASEIHLKANNTYNTGHFHLDDDDYLKIGSSDDLNLYHNGSNSFIQHGGTGDLYIDTLNNSADMYIRSKDNLHLMTNNNAQNSVVCVGNSGVILYNAGTAKFNTDGDGAIVTSNRLAINRNAGDSYLQFQTSGTTHATLYGGSSTGFRIFTGGTQQERLRIDSSGRVMIGTTT